MDLNSLRDMHLVETDWLQDHLSDSDIRIVDMRGKVKVQTAPDGFQSAEYLAARQDFDLGTEPARERREVLASGKHMLRARDDRGNLSAQQATKIRALLTKVDLAVLGADCPLLCHEIVNGLVNSVW